MGRKLATAIIALALLLAGFQPMAAPAMGAMAATMDMKQSCCPDCGPAQPDKAPCGALAGCALRCLTVAPSTILPGSLAPVFYPLDRSVPWADDVSAARADAVPPFRPPRS